MKVDGEASLLLNEHLGTGGHANVSSTGPVLGQSPAQKAFEKLGSGSAAPAVAAKVGGGGRGRHQRGRRRRGRPEGQIEGGLKGRVKAEWRFDAGGASNTCDGIGGMLTLLGGLGASAALPKPFDQAFGGAVFKSFMPQLQHCRFSVGGTVGGDADIKTAGGLAELKLHGNAEVMENFELKKDAHGNLVSERTRTLQAQIGATARGGAGLRRLGQVPRLRRPRRDRPPDAQLRPSDRRDPPEARPAARSRSASGPRTSRRT